MFGFCIKVIAIADKEVNFCERTGKIMRSGGSRAFIRKRVHASDAFGVLFV